ncbi:MAG: putative quinol monooxygenase [Halieaceae bacterium]|nr:putative quinol monooxygenase [Halieaceae bacterium]
MIIVHGAIEIDPDRWEEAIELSLEHVERSRAEQGCISHAVHIDAENPNRLVFFEEWESMDALQAHFQVPASGEFVQQLGALATSDPQMRIFESEQKA